VLRALGAVGAELLQQYPGDSLKDGLSAIQSIDWKKSNRRWERVCIIANSVVSNRQARLATKAEIKRHLCLALDDVE
jgi:DNA sulfur modification protein DndB